MNNIEFVVVPSLNPDGYEYTHTANRLWRKNRADYGTCKVIEPNTHPLEAMSSLFAETMA